jgi:post-segregation antitoxin (ccd killing protein)
MALTRVTLTLDSVLMEEARRLSGGNFSRFVSRMLEDRLEELRRQRLREELRAGYEAEAAHDLEVAGES